ncbi:hypothetical protein ACLMJK_000767 [Lecanora helva]
MVYHDSDADDEYERSVMTSPILPTDDDTSPTDSDPPSTEPTPTTFGQNIDQAKLSPSNTIVGWTADQCADYISNLGLPQYCDKFLENEIVGEALIALRHEELKEMAIVSIGHRLTILKGVYDVKVKQDIPIDPDHWMPPSADAETQDRTATKDDIARIIRSIEIRDHRIQAAEAELRKITEEYRRLRDELLPIFRMAKENQPLPYHPARDSPEHHEEGSSPMVSQMSQEKIGSSLSRKFSTKRLFLGSTPKSSSPTHIPQSIPEGRSMTDTNLDPSAAAVAASNHLTATVNGGSQPSMSPSQANIPSPTSPNTYVNQNTLYTKPPYQNREQKTPSTARNVYSNADDSLGYSSFPPEREPRANPPQSSGRSTRGPTRDQYQELRQAQQEETPTSSSGPSVEIFKSFRVSMDDPCEKVLPAALKKYNIQADWRQYALYIVYGDQERCLGLREKPLELFKQLDKEGRKPMFMLRRHAAPMEGHSGPSGSSAGIGAPVQSDSMGGLGSGRGHQSSTLLPGGVI